MYIHIHISVPIHVPIYVHVCIHRYVYIYTHTTCLQSRGSPAPSRGLVQLPRGPPPAAGSCQSSQDAVGRDEVRLRLAAGAGSSHAKERVNPYYVCDDVHVCFQIFNYVWHHVLFNKQTYGYRKTHTYECRFTYIHIYVCIHTYKHRAQ